MSYDNSTELAQIVDNMTTLTPAQKKTFVSESMFGAPLDKLAAYLSKPASERSRNSQRWVSLSTVSRDRT